MGKLLGLIMCLLFVGCGNNGKTQMESTGETSQTAREKPVSKTKEIPTLVAGEGWYVGGNREVEVTIKEVKTLRLRDGTYNLVLKVQIKNNSSYSLDIGDIYWKLTDTDMIEVEERGEYDPTFGFFAGIFWTTTVDSGFGKNATAGYQVSKGTYYLSLGGEIAGKIEVGI
jgi:hypothetical protein